MEPRQWRPAIKCRTIKDRGISGAPHSPSVLTSSAHPSEGVPKGLQEKTILGKGAEKPPFPYTITTCKAMHVKAATLEQRPEDPWDTSRPGDPSGIHTQGYNGLLQDLARGQKGLLPRIGLGRYKLRVQKSLKRHLNQVF